MRILILFIGLLCFNFSARSQSSLISDSLLLETCRSLANNAHSSDTEKIDAAFNLHLFPVLKGLNDSLISVTLKYIDIRLQKLCPEFKKYLDELNPPKDDWTPVQVRPESKMDKNSAREFLLHKRYYYFDQDMDTVNLSLSHSYWVDHFKNGTYSKLLFKWTGNTTFEISFVESNNEIRKNLSKPGERYIYELIEKFPDYYLVYLHMPELKVFGTFRIYYD
ncbi:MAG: hypothetical protein JWQ27_81 [Ferruginibacter sp.]|nr:hypothetical protein [Ferruginibacter sp.]